VVSSNVERRKATSSSWRCRTPFVQGLIWLVLFLTSLSASFSAPVGAGENPVFINVFMHTVDPINVELSHKHILRIARLFDEVGVKADLYFRGPLIDTFATHRQEAGLVPFLKEFFGKGNGIGYLGYVHHPLPRELAKGMGWDEALDACRCYLGQRSNIFTGEMEESEIGGARLATELLGKPVDIARRHHLIQEAFLLRQQGGVMNIGHVRDDFVADFAPRPLAWHLGMIAVVNYPVPSTPSGVNVAGLHKFGETPEQVRRSVEKMINERPRGQIHFFYLGNHNTDMYADNTKWNALRRGHPNHVENWYYTDTDNPKDRDSARLPAEFLLSPDQVERRYRLRETVLWALKEVADKNPSVHLLTARALYNLLKEELEFSVSPRDLDKVCQAVVTLPGGSLPPYIQLDSMRCLTLAEAFDLLARALHEFGSDGKHKWPESLRPNPRTLAPTSIPDCWMRESASGTPPSTVSLREVLMMASQLVSFELSLSSDPEIPAQFYPSEGKEPINASTCLYAMAQAYRSLRQSRTDEIELPQVDMIPKPLGARVRKWISDESARDLSLIDQYHLLQVWTIKSVLFAAVTGEGAKI